MKLFNTLASDEQITYKLKVDCTLPKGLPYDKTILVFGDSFAELGVMHLPLERQERNENMAVENSWMHHLCHSVYHNVRSFGVSGGSEQLIFEIFKKSLQIKRDYTIIFHTNPFRRDHYTGLPLLESKDYLKWDELVDERTLHLYWHSQLLYQFKNGKTLMTNYWNTKQGNFDNLMDKDVRFRGSNHMTYYGNLLLTKDIIDTIGEELGA